jgi:nitrile hydratase
MSMRTGQETRPLPNVVKAEFEEPMFREGDTVRIKTRSPIGHFRTPNYIRGKRGRVELVIKHPAVDNEEEGFGRNAGQKRHYYRIALPMTELWANYKGPSHDGLRIEVFESWLRKDSEQ